MATTLRNQIPLAALASILLAIGASAQQPASLPPPGKDPFVGTWQANAEKSRPKLSKKDSAYRRTIARDGEDLLFSSQTKNPKPSENTYRIRCDGQFHQVPFGSLSCKYDTSNLIEGVTEALDAKIRYWSREVSSDGQEMKISTYEDVARRNLTSVWVLDRVN